MPSSKTMTIGALLFALNALTAQAFHVEYGTSCSTVGEACSYVSNDSSTGGDEFTTVNGFCAPDLHCASQGAKCTSDDSCFNYCGTDGMCGGEGAGCNTQLDFVPGQPFIACDNSGDFRCTATSGNVGQCLPSDQVTLAEVDDTTDSTPTADAPVAGASQVNARRSKRRLDNETVYHQNQVRSEDLRRAFARHAAKQGSQKL